MDLMYTASGSAADLIKGGASQGAAKALWDGLGWMVEKKNEMNAYAIFGIWAFAVVASIICLFNRDSNDTAKQGTYNTWNWWVQVSVLLMIFFTIRFVSVAAYAAP